uniref:Fibronectin type III domain containing 3Ba n=1 Tax=Oncorhynchus mykiss TaxID=8022 RepID=A0A8K9UHP1_ONCMY
MVNGDAAQQVILVQVNPGETFTIRAEDGSLQCIQGPAEVPMMSPNGSIPPIHVPPGYISQVLEDNTGVRRVVVTPQSPECYPPSYSPALSPTHHLPPYLTHPHFIPNSHSFYPPVSPGDLSPHQYYQHHLPPIYGEGKILTPQSKMCLWAFFDFLFHLYLTQCPKKGQKYSEWCHLRRGGSENHQSQDGEELECHLKDLRPASDYHVRVSAVCNSNLRGVCSETGSFTTHTCPPDLPFPPKLSHRSKSTLTLQWKPPVDNGSKITNYLLEWDEGKKNSVFRECYFGSQRHCKLTRLCPAVGYTFRVAAHNDIGTSGFSTEVVFYTTGTLPSCPLAPRLLRAGVSWVTLEWGRPEGSANEELITYTLEIQEDNTGTDFHPKYTGDNLTSTVQGLKRSTQYKFRVRVCLSLRFYCGEMVSGCVLPWKRERLVFSGQWEVAYSGPATECVCEELTPGTVYRLRVCSISTGGHSQVKHTHTHTHSPEGSGSDISEYRLDWSREEEPMELIYCGPETQCEVSDLTPATHYCCRLQAVNQAGAGPYSEQMTFQTPATNPDAVSSFFLLDQLQSDQSPSTCLFLKWEEPNCNGADITSYIISLDDQLITVETGTSHLITDLQPDSQYSVQIQAVNVIGCGPLSPPLVARTRPLPPAPPPLECSAAGPQSLKLKWGENAAHTHTRALLSNDMFYTLQMEDKNHRFVCIYRGPSHTYKVQRLTESTSYRFRIQACSDAGEGPFSDTHTFSTTKTVPSALKAPRVHQLEGNVCEVTWEAIPPMRGDRVNYILQVLVGRESEYKQVFKGEESAFQITGLQGNTDYRFRVCACRRCQDTNHELCGPLSPSSLFTLRRQEQQCLGETSAVETVKGAGIISSDERFAAVVVCVFAGVSILMACLLQYFFMK